jgi:hypothetical protein
MEPTGIQLPRNTPWPLVLAMGISLLFAGIVTSLALTCAGAVVVVLGCLGWWRDVLPEETVEVEDLLPIDQQPVLSTTDTSIAHLSPGRDGHRMHLPVAIHPYRLGVVAGLAGGVAMAAVAMTYGLLSHGSIFWPVNLLGAMMLPSLESANIETLEAFHLGGLLAGVMIHLVASISVGLIYAVTLPMAPRHPVLLGAVALPVIWTPLLYAGMFALSPILLEHVNWWWFSGSQVAFGVVAGLLISRGEKIPTMQFASLEARLGVEATGLMEEEEKA